MKEGCCGTSWKYARCCRIERYGGAQSGTARSFRSLRGKNAHAACLSCKQSRPFMPSGARRGGDTVASILTLVVSKSLSRWSDALLFQFSSLLRLLTPNRSPFIQSLFATWSLMADSSRRFGRNDFSCEALLSPPRFTDSILTVVTSVSFIGSRSSAVNFNETYSKTESNECIIC